MIDPLVAGLSDPDPEQRRKAVFGVLSHRRHDLLPALYELALREKEGELAVLATQAALMLRASPPDPQQVRLIEKALAEKGGHNRLGPASWEYLAVSGTRGQRLRLLAELSRGGKPPRQIWSFIESCMGHCDPDVRTAACRPAVATGYGRLLAWVLAAIEDPDAGVGREAFSAVEQASRPLLVEALEEAVDDSDEWVPGTVAPFLPILADEDMRDLLKRGRENPLPVIVARSREALGRLDARKLASRHLSPPSPIRQTPAAQQTVIQLVVPSATQSHSKPSASPVPPGPLPWAHLVTLPPPAPAAQFPAIPEASPRGSFPVTGSGVDKPSAPSSEPGVEPVMPVTPVSRDPGLSIGGSSVMPATGRGTVKKERVISMRGKISGDDAASMPISPPALSPEDQAALFFGGTKPPPTVAIGGLTEGPVPAAGENALEPPVKSPEPAQIETSESWESVPLDLAAAASERGSGPLRPPTEPRLAVSLPPVSPPPVAGAITLVKPQMVDAIIERYPSFIAIPTAQLFEPADAEMLMKALHDLLEPLTAFLSFTFMQTYLFYASRSPKGDQVVKEALKAHFAGPNTVRFLHHLSLLIKDASSDSFFTIPLAKAMSESSADTNPLFILREMVEFLQTPPADAAEGLAQVADALPSLLAAFKGILQNPIVMRLPPGAREPFLNLSGPKSVPLAADDRPGLDLPPNEIILLSKDRSEALGLFPYFTFDGQKVMFKTPSDADFKTLLERLEMTL